MLAERDDDFRSLEQAKVTHDRADEPVWPASYLQRALGYDSDRHFQKAVNQAKVAVNKADMPVRDHFINGNLFDAPGEVFITKYAAMMILFNADSSKVAVAVAQSYFALLCDKQGLEDEKRIRSRLDVTTENTKLSGVAKETGVQDFQKFNGMGVSGLYGGLNVRQIVARKKLKPGSQHLDFAGSEELAANLFRITQTAAALCRAGRVGEATACRTHEQIGRGIRQAILSAGNRPPEDLPAAGMAIDQTATKVKKSLKSGK